MSIPGCNTDLKRFSMLVKEKMKDQNNFETIVIVLYINEEPFYCFHATKEFYYDLKEAIGESKDSILHDAGMEFKLLSFRQYLFNKVIKIDCILI